MKDITRSTERIPLVALSLAAFLICFEPICIGSANSAVAPRLLGFADESVTALAIDPRDSSTLYVATDDNRIFKSSDGGASWKSDESVYANTVAIDPTNSSVVYASWGSYRGGH